METIDVRRRMKELFTVQGLTAFSVLADGTYAGRFAFEYVQKETYRIHHPVICSSPDESALSSSPPKCHISKSPQKFAGYVSPN